jgi:hypothetical protein
VLAWRRFSSSPALVLAVRFWVLPDIERYRDDMSPQCRAASACR